MIKTKNPIDWYENRHRLKPGMVFRTFDGIVKLDRSVPGDATAWYVADWDGQSWGFWDGTAEAADLDERLPEME